MGWPLSVIALLYVLNFLMENGKEVIPNIRSFDLPFLTIGTILFLLCYFIRVYIWWDYLRIKGYKLSFKETLYRWEFSELKRFVPGNVWSFLSRGSLFSDLGVDKKDTAKGLIYEIEILAISTTFLSLLSIPLAYQYISRSSIFLAGAVFIGILIFTVFFLFPSLFPIKSLRKLLPDIPFLQNLKLLILVTMAFFFFGAGTFFSALSVVEIDLSKFFEYVGFFSLSLLIGYLSIITPSGLGVREGVITFGLSKTLSFPQAALIAIFSRIMLIVSELIFALIVFVLAKSLKKTLKQIVGLIKKNKHETALIVLFVLYISYFTAATFLKYDNYYTGRFDLGNMAQTLWNTYHGRLFILTDPNGVEIFSRLAFHADFILILLSPLYFFWEDPRILLLVQTLILGAGGIFVYLIAGSVLKNKNISLIISFAYFINPAVNYVNLFDFHGVALATTFFLATFYFILKKKWVLVVVFLFLSAITKEQVWLTVALFGGYIFFFYKQKLLGLSIFAISSLIFYFLIWHAIPNSLGGDHFALQFYSELGSSPSEIIKGVILNPAGTVQTLLQREQMDFIRQIFSPLSYLSLILAINLLSENGKLHQIYYQYSSIITPFIFISAIYSIFYLKKHIPSIPLKLFAIMIIFSSVYSAYSYGPLPFAKKEQTVMFTKPLPERTTVDNFIAGLSENTKISASNNLGSHLSHRHYIYTIPNGLDRADYILLLIRKDNELSIKSPIGVLKRL
ncbi:MAG: DUF2079 domain-containing protein [Candidatus Levybacteria bacterium]|nr:DUF2079 domain-containing protein [Candidatus Levybacteria bacterium]